MFNKLFFLSLVICSISAISVFSGCKGCKKDAPVTTVDSTATAAPAIDMISTPHGDTSLIPVFTQILDEAFAASAKKDYVGLGKLMVYRAGSSMERFGNDVYNANDPYEKAIVKATGEVMHKWNSAATSKEYPRVFSMPQGDGRELQVLEVIFIGKKVNRKFFAFLMIGDQYKIVDVTSYLQ